LASSSGRSSTGPAASLRLAAGSSSPLILAICKPHVVADRLGGAAPPPYRDLETEIDLLGSDTDRVYEAGSRGVIVPS
jgi:hypothetical protein